MLARSSASLPSLPATATTKKPETTTERKRTKEENEQHKFTRQQAICDAQDKHLLQLEIKKNEDLQKKIELNAIKEQIYQREKLIAENEFNQLFNKNRILQEKEDSLEAKNAILEKNSDLLLRILKLILG